MSSNILTLYSKIKYRCSPRRGGHDVCRGRVVTPRSCESGVAAAALVLPDGQPQSKATRDYRDGGRNCLHPSKAGAVGQVARQNGLVAPFHPKERGRWPGWRVRYVDTT